MKRTNEWMSISDMMSGLMLIFLFVAVAFMLNVEDDKTKLQKAKEKITQIALTYQKSKIELNKDLHKEFDKDLKRWNAEITKDNSIIFNSPEVLFETGKSEIKEKFKEALAELQNEMLNDSEWIKDWNICFKNFETNYQYNGINVLLIAQNMSDRNHKQPYFMTFKQAKARNYKKFSIFKRCNSCKEKTNGAGYPGNLN